MSLLVAVMLLGYSKVLEALRVLDACTSGGLARRLSVFVQVIPVDVLALHLTGCIKEPHGFTSAVMGLAMLDKGCPSGLPSESTSTSWPH
jgi:hypothetical protein